MGGHHLIVPEDSTTASGQPRITIMKLLHNLSPASGATDPPRRRQSYSAEISHDAAFLVQSCHRAILASARQLWTSMMLYLQAEPAEARRVRRNALTADGGVMLPFTM